MTNLCSTLLPNSFVQLWFENGFPQMGMAIIDGDKRLCKNGLLDKLTSLWLCKLRMRLSVSMHVEQFRLVPGCLQKLLDEVVTVPPCGAFAGVASGFHYVALCRRCIGFLQLRFHSSRCLPGKVLARLTAIWTNAVAVAWALYSWTHPEQMDEFGAKCSNQMCHQWCLRIKQHSCRDRPTHCHHVAQQWY